MNDVSCAPVNGQNVVAWIHQRYIWHTTALEEVTHAMFYEDLQVWLCLVDVTVLTPSEPCLDGCPRSLLLT